MTRLNRRPTPKTLALALLLPCMLAGAAASQTAPPPPAPAAPPVQAQPSRVDIAALTDETQRQSPDPGRVTLIWWIPEEYWQANLAQDPNSSKAQTEEFLKAVRPYVMFAVIDGKIGAFGGVTYKSEAEVRSTVEVVDSRGVSYRPLAADKVDPDTRNLLAIMKPILSNAMGKAGENMHFIVFPANDSAGRRIADPLKEGTFALKFGADVYRWRLPLGSLMPAKTCPVDGEVLNGAWKFCPWHGDRLVTKP